MVDNWVCADVEFLVGKEAMPVYASKVILIARSPVFEALLNGSFCEGLPHDSLVVSSLMLASPCLPLVFWHSVLVLDLELCTLRHLLHWCYTNTLHPKLIPDNNNDNNNNNADPSQLQRDLVQLYTAADHFLLKDCSASAAKELRKALDNDMQTVPAHSSRVLATFDLALGIAPKLAKSVCLKAISFHAYYCLGGLKTFFHEDEQQWLHLSLAAAEELLAADLRGIEEVDLFRAIERRHQHHLRFPDDDQQTGTPAASDSAIKKVASLVGLINTRLMSTHEIREVVEPSGLFSTEQLMKAYRRAARSHRFIVPALRSTPAVEFDDRVAQGKVSWRIEVSLCDIINTYNIRFVIEPRKNVTIPRRVACKGISLTVFFNRRCIKQVTFSGSTAVPGRLGTTIEVDSQPYARLTILVRVPATALQEVKK